VTENGRPGLSWQPSVAGYRVATAPGSSEPHTVSGRIHRRPCGLSAIPALVIEELSGVPDLLLGFEIEAPYYCFGLTGGLRRRERALEARYLTTAARPLPGT
jgi:hypothetical protein